MRNRSTILVLAVAVAPLAHLGSPRGASAGGFAVGEQTAVSAGTGNAGVARDDDPGAAWHVPAALADGKGLRLDASLIVARPSLEARALDGSWSETNEGAWATPPHLNVSFARDRWAAGISLGVPFGSGVTWPGDWQGQYEIVQTQLQVFRAAPFFAWSFGKLRASAGFHVDAGRLQIARDLDFIDVEGDVAIDMSGRGVGVDAALYYQAMPALSFGLAYRGRTRMALSGGANFTAPDAFAGKVPDQNAKSELVLPDQIVAGTRYDFGTYAALLDVELTMWSTHARTTVDFAHEATPDVMQENGWRNTLSVRTGGEWTRGRLVLRHGAYYDQSPAPRDRLAPSSPDSTRIGLTAGASWRFDRAWSADAFVESMFILRRDTASMDALQASYGGRAMLGGLGVRWTP
ncbi:MAG: outer membrane protein transport protein [Deltaproteobacteria bacterium]|nr:outer membrane protein transport protein [Deltaproteobacteria bacterium]MDQ3295343.1 outer membrane protein transport protein [Myxococcota bacterium]